MLKLAILCLLPMTISCTTNVSYPNEKRAGGDAAATKAGAPAADAAASAPDGPGSDGAGTDSVFPYIVHRGVFANGMKVLVIPMQSEGLVSYWTVVRTGSRDEVEKGVTGFAHFFEHMMFRGSEKYPSKVYNDIVSGLGADANAFTTDDFTAYHLAFAKEDLATVAEIESDRFQNLKYNEADFKTESGAVYGEYRKGRTSPFEVLFESIQDKAFDKHTYKHTTIGFESDIKAMPSQFKYSQSFFSRFYRPENCVVIVAGDVNPKDTIELLYNKYGGWKKGYVEPDVAAEPAQTAQRRVDVPFDGRTLPFVTIGFKGEKFIPGDRTMMAGLLLADLCFGETSPLYKKLVLEEQRVEQILTDISPKRDPGLWTVFATVKDKNDLGGVERELWRTLQEMRARPVASDRLADVKSRWKYNFLGGLSTPNQVASSLAPLVAITGDMECVYEMFATLDRVTPDDVRRAAATYFTEERATVAILHGKDEPLPAAKAAGENFVLMPVENDPNVAFKLWFKAGSQDDPPGKEGLAALTAAMISEGGTQKSTYDEILAKLFPMAASYGASVDKEMTVIGGVAHRDNAAAFYNILSEAILSPGMRPEDFERLRDRAVNGIEKVLRYSSDEELGKATLEGAVFDGTRYGHLIDGSVASLKSITIDDVKAFYNKYYTRGNVVIGLGGAYAKSLPLDVQSDIDRLPAGAPAPAPAPRAAAFEGRHVTIVEKPGPSTAISLGFPIDLARGSKDFYALSIARSWLGEHRNSFSHLYQVIREARGLNYGDYAYIEAFPNGGSRIMPPTGVGRRAQMFQMWIRPVPEENAPFALRAGLRELESLAKNGMTQKEFESARKFLKKYSLHYAETTSERLGYALEDRFYGIDGHLAKFRSMMDTLTLEDVNSAIKKYLCPENMRLALVTEHAEKLRDAIAGGAPTPVTYPKDADIPKEVLQEDKTIESYPLRIPAANIVIVPVDKMFAK